MQYTEFLEKFHSLHRKDPKFKQLCQDHPEHFRNATKRAWQQIALIRQRKLKHSA